MKGLWTLVFLATIATAAGVALLLIPESARGDNFWLSLGGVVVALLLLYWSLAFGPQAGREQGREVVRGQSVVAGAVYLLATLGLAALALVLTFKVLLALHLIALLGWIILTAMGAMGAVAMRGADGKDEGR